MAKLVGWQGQDLLEHTLEADRSLVVGRGRSCSLSLATASKAVSREHFRVVPLPGGRHQLVDLGSTNGTYVNGARVGTAQLEPRDVVRLGEVELLYLPAHEDAREALRARAGRRQEQRPVQRAGPARSTARRRLLCERLLRLTLTCSALDVDTDEALRGLLGTLLEEAMAFSSCQWGGIYLCDEPRPWIVVRPQGRPPIALAIEAAVEEALRTQHSCLRPCVGGSILCMPLAGSRWPGASPSAQRPQQDAAGALVLLAAHGLEGLSGDDQQLLEAVASQTASLARRACLHRQATIDHLTGLSTRASTERVLTRELRRVGIRRPLSVILLDLDHFKAINDVHGHPVGDQVLREVARRTRAALQGGGTAGRWGGEEFLIVLPGVGKAAARSVAAAIARALRATPIGRTRVAVTASLGVATFPEDGDDLDELLRGADRALYSAKARGRDQVAVCDRDATTGADPAEVVDDGKAV